MIGQVKVIENLKKTKAKSVLLTGPPHWGKKTLLRELFSKEESVYEITGNASVFRESVDRIYQTVRPTIYLIPDVDKANQTVQNLLLKVLEEPPMSARFFLTASGSVLPTIVSRCVTYRMEPYKDTNSELGGLQAPACILGMFRSPGQLHQLKVDGIEEVVNSLIAVRNDFDSRTLANVLLSVKAFHKQFANTALTQDAFLLLVHHVFGTSDSLDWLRQQPQDSVKYVRTAYFMKLWVERQVLRQ